MISVSPGAWRGVNNPGVSTEDGKVEKQSLFPTEHHIKNTLRIRMSSAKERTFERIVPLTRQIQNLSELRFGS
jgi:hypothetical protein